MSPRKKRAVSRPYPSETKWRMRVNAKTRQRLPDCSDAAQIAAMFGLCGEVEQRLYERFELALRPGEIVAVVGPSGAGKSVLLREARRRWPGAVRLDLEALSRRREVAAGLLRGGSLARRLEMLSRCGLADAHALVTPAGRLSGGQRYRLALAEAMHRARRRGRATLVIADEFASTLDFATAILVCRQMRKMVQVQPLANSHKPTGKGNSKSNPIGTAGRPQDNGKTEEARSVSDGCRRTGKTPVAGSQVPSYGIGLLLATPRVELLPYLRPDRVIVKPLGEAAFVLETPDADWSGTHCDVDTRSEDMHAEASTPRHDPRTWPVARGTIADYHALAAFHYLAGPPAAHKRVYVIRPARGICFSGTVPLPGTVPRFLIEPSVAAVLVVSPPVMNVRGRNLAVPGRYSGPDRRGNIARLNREVECISRVVVHPIYRGCGLAVRLVRHALADAATPHVEALAAMGAVHPFFELAGMQAFRPGIDEGAARLLSAAQAVGLSPQQVGAVEPMRIMLRRGGRRGRFLRREVAVCTSRMFDPKRLACMRRLGRSVLAEACRRATRQYVYYFGARDSQTTAFATVIHARTGTRKTEKTVPP